MLTTGDPVERTSHTETTKGGDPSKVEKDGATESDNESSGSRLSHRVLPQDLLPFLSDVPRMIPPVWAVPENGCAASVRIPGLLKPTVETQDDPNGQVFERPEGHVTP